MPDPGYNIFVSWSGESSHRVAQLLRDWLPDVVREAVPWLSTVDLGKGSSWTPEIASALAAVKLGIVVLTPQNLAAPWLLFEAGALSHAIEPRRVCTLLCGTSPPLTGPLAQFQATTCTKEDIWRLVTTIASALGHTTTSRLQRWFDTFWPKLEPGLEEAIRGVTATPATQPAATDRELLIELLSLARTPANHMPADPYANYRYPPAEPIPNKRVWHSNTGAGQHSFSRFTDWADRDMERLAKEYPREVLDAETSLRDAWYSDRNKLPYERVFLDGRRLQCGPIVFYYHYEDLGDGLPHKKYPTMVVDRVEYVTREGV